MKIVRAFLRLLFTPFIFVGFLWEQAATYFVVWQKISRLLNISE